jgi:hypothetical protein
MYVCTASQVLLVSLVLLDQPGLQDQQQVRLTNDGSLGNATIITCYYTQQALCI